MWSPVCIETSLFYLLIFDWNIISVLHRAKVCQRSSICLLSSFGNLFYALCHVNMLTFCKKIWSYICNFEALDLSFGLIWPSFVFGLIVRILNVYLNNRRSSKLLEKIFLLVLIFFHWRCRWTGCMQSLFFMFQLRIQYSWWSCLPRWKNRYFETYTIWDGVICTSVTSSWLERCCFQLLCWNGCFQFFLFVIDFGFLQNTYVLTWEEWEIVVGN